jgi:hypothetical protein
VLEIILVGVTDDYAIARLIGHAVRSIRGGNAPRWGRWCCKASAILAADCSG